MKRKANEQSLKEVIDEMLKAYKLDGRLSEVRLINSWEKVVGKMIARHTKDLYISRRKLYITLDSAALRDELSYARTKILNMLNEEAGTEVIEEVIFK